MKNLFAFSLGFLILVHLLETSWSLPLCTGNLLLCALNMFGSAGLLQLRFHIDIIAYYDLHISGRHQFMEEIKLKELKDELTSEEALAFQQAEIAVLDEIRRNEENDFYQAQLEFWERKAANRNYKIASDDVLFPKIKPLENSTLSIFGPSDDTLLFEQDLDTEL